MKNAVGRDIPEFLLEGGREVYQGKNYMDGRYMQKAAPKTRRYEKPQESKLVSGIAEALRQMGASDGMTFSFHHHLRNGDFVANMVMQAAVEELGLKDLKIAATSLGEAHDPIADYIEQGVVTGIQTSGIRGRIGEVVSAGKLKTPAVIRSHGGRPRAIEAGEVHIDIAVVAAPTSDCVGNCRGIGGKSNCGSLGYAMTEPDRIGNSREAENYCLSILAGERTERFYVISLNAKCNVLGRRKISEGSLSEVSAYPRMVMETALNYNAHSVLLCHNHPGGTCAPSPEDISSTIQLQRLLNGVGILVLDHIIVAGDRTYSMIQHGDIDYRIKGR